MVKVNDNEKSLRVMSNNIPVNIPYHRYWHVCLRAVQNGYGTTLPAIYEWKRHQRGIGDIYIAGAHIEGINILRRRLTNLINFLVLRFVLNFSRKRCFRP